MLWTEGLSCFQFYDDNAFGTTTYGRIKLPVNKFYSVRFVAGEGEIGELNYLKDFNSTAVGIGSVSISECPGDFGQVDQDLFNQLASGANDFELRPQTSIKSIQS